MIGFQSREMYKPQKTQFLACSKLNISGSFYPFQARHVSFESSRHGEFLKKKR